MHNMCILVTSVCVRDCLQHLFAVLFFYLSKSFIANEENAVPESSNYFRR